jgi:hypothetical protein
MEGELLDQVVPPGSGLTKAAMALANRWVTNRQLGFLLGFMGTRVLGQYDLALLSVESTPGRLLFVEENIRATATSLGVPLGAFRTWIALHETTHALSSRRTSCGPISPSGSSASSGSSRATPAASGARRCAGWAGPSAARVAGNTGWSN